MVFIVHYCSPLLMKSVAKLNICSFDSRQKRVIYVPCGYRYDDSTQLRVPG